MTFVEFWLISGALVTWGSIEASSPTEKEKQERGMDRASTFSLFLNVMINILAWPLTLGRLFRYVKS